VHHHLLKSLKATLGVVVLLAVASIVAVADGRPAVVDANATPCVSRFSAHYTTVQAAVSAAQPNSIILVCPGIYPEQVTITTSLTLRGVIVPGASGGAGAGASIIGVPSSPMLENDTALDAQVLIQATNVTLDGITVDGLGGAPTADCSVPNIAGVVFAAGSSGRVTRSAIRNQASPNGANGVNGFCGYGVVVDPGAGGMVNVEASSIRGFGTNGVLAESPVTVRNNVLSSGMAPNPSVDQSVGISLSDVSTVNGNTIGHVAVGIFFGSGSGNVNNNSIAADQIGVGLFTSSVTAANNTLTPGAQNTPSGTVGIAVLGSTDTLQNNEITGTTFAIFAVPGGSTINHNTIDDAGIGILGATGNTVGGGNTFLNVETLVE
jgi:hypothetical protein